MIHYAYQLLNPTDLIQILYNGCNGVGMAQ